METNRLLRLINYRNRKYSRNWFRTRKASMNKELKMRKKSYKIPVRQQQDRLLVVYLHIRMVRMNRDQSSNQRLKTMRVVNSNSESSMEVIRPNNNIITIPAEWRKLCRHRTWLRTQSVAKIPPSNNRHQVEITTAHHRIQVRCRTVGRLLFNSSRQAANISWIGKGLLEV